MRILPYHSISAGGRKILPRLFLICLLWCLLAGCESPAAPEVHAAAPDDGWQVENGVSCHLEPDGTPSEGWADLDGSRYYFRSDGTPHTGWLEVDGHTYYFTETGAMARGQVEIDGQAHFFTADGEMILLVNPTHAMPEGYEPALVALDVQYGMDGMLVDESCLDALTEMLDACNSQGGRAYVLSAYRDYESQQQLHDRKVNDLMAAGASEEDARAEAATVVVLPGHSEHHLGLAVDIIDTRRWVLDEAQEDLPAQKWLIENSWRYGFILRYPKDKTESTGVIYEPWHYRYVGTDLAEALWNSGLTLEEYMDTLDP